MGKSGLDIIETSVAFPVSKTLSAGCCEWIPYVTFIRHRGAPNKPIQGMDMMMVIPIKAVGKERPRYSSKTKSFFTPKKTKEFEAEIGAYAMLYMKSNNIQAIEGPVTVNIIVKVKTPTSWTKRRTEAAIQGEIMPTVTPDIDNCLKSILDGMNGITWKDDKQVIKCSIEKLYHEEDVIEIKVFANMGSKLNIDKRFKNFGLKGY